MSKRDLWMIFDLMRISAAVGLTALAITTTAPMAQVSLGTFIVTGLVVSAIRRTAEGAEG